MCEGEKSDEVDEMEDWRLGTCLEAGNDGKLEVAGEKAAREPLGEGLLLRWSAAIAVEMGGRRALWCCLEEPQEYCWLI